MGTHPLPALGAHLPHCHPNSLITSLPAKGALASAEPQAYPRVGRPASSLVSHLLGVSWHFPRVTLPAQPSA